MDLIHNQTASAQRWTSNLKKIIQYSYIPSIQMARAQSKFKLGNHTIINRIQYKNRTTEQQYKITNRINNNRVTQKYDHNRRKKDVNNNRMCNFLLIPLIQTKISFCKSNKWTKNNKI